MPFQHPHAKSASVRYTAVDGGNMKAHTLVVEASIPLRPGAGYSSSKVGELQRAAVDYAKRQSLAEVEFLAVD